MRQMFTVFYLSLLLAGLLQAQDWASFNEERNQLNRRAMMTLGGWALANIAVNSALYRYESNQPRRYFYQMNAAWNVINLAIAGIGYYGSMQTTANPGIYQSINEQANIEKILLFNAGLDVAYVMTGVFLLEKARNTARHAARLSGYGRSLILQGGFLFVFDIAVFYLQHRNFQRAAELLNHVQWDVNKLTFRFYF